MQKITGYSMGKISYDEMEAEMNRIKEKVTRIGKDAYHRLLGEEIAFLCDAVTLNMLNRDGHLSIFDAAVRNIEVRITQAKSSENDNPYAFSIYSHILKVDDEFILKVVTGHERYLTAFRKYESLCLDDIEINNLDNAKTKLWDRVEKIYGKKAVLFINLTPDEFIPDMEQVVFPDFDERIKKMARHSVLNHYMNQLAGGNQIPPFLLMPYFDKALAMFSSPAGVYAYERKQKELTQILLELKKDSDFIMKA